MHLLPDNPVWQALSSRQQHLNIGGDSLKFFAMDVSPFVGLEQWNDADMKLLNELLPAGRNFSVMIAGDVMIPDHFETIFSCMLYQMVCNTAVQIDSKQTMITSLNTAHIPAMLELTALTKPGPFFQNTISLGNYYGIFENGQLVSMAGERLKLPGYTEVSAICTHPDHLGKGYAAMLTSHVVRHIQSEGHTAFLHVKTDNERAIKVYQRLGFDVRTEVYFAIFRKRVEITKGR